MKKQIITAGKARSMVTRVGWLLIRRGFEAFSRDMRFVVYGCQGIYYKRPCFPRW